MLKRRNAETQKTPKSRKRRNAEIRLPLISPFQHFSVLVFQRFSGTRPAFSYVETIISVVILSTGIVTGMNLYGTYARGMIHSSEVLVGQELAADLMAEVLTKEFKEPGIAPGSFGRDGSEATRRDFDDVDDYDTWSESPPADLDGNPLAAGAYDGYQRSVRVWNVDSTDLSTVGTDGSTSAKVIEVTVSRNGKLRAQLIAHRTRHSGYD